MKLSLPVKLGIFVLLLFAVVVGVGLAWKPIMIRYYRGNLNSQNLDKAIQSINNLIWIGKEGRAALVENFPDGKEGAELLFEVWDNVNKEIDNVTFIIPMIDHPPENLSNVSSDNCMAIHIAAKRGFYRLAELLIARNAVLTESAEVSWNESDDPGSSLHSKSGTPLNLSIFSGRTDLFNLLLRQDIVRSSRNISENLFEAAWDSNVSVARLLFRYGADANYEIDDGLAPIHLAVFLSRKDYFELLIREGADINTLTKAGMSPLDIAFYAEKEIHFSNGSHTYERQPVTEEFMETRKAIADLLRAHGAKTSEELEAEKIK